jgi:putative DNA primase/helicase
MSNIPHPKGGKAARSASAAEAPANLAPSSSARTTSRQIRERALSLSEVLVLRLPPDVELLGRMILAGTLGLLYGMRGGGKSLLAMIIAYAIAGRKFVQPWGQGSGDAVCYLDGEMRIHGFQERLEQLHAFNTDEESMEAVREKLWIVSRHLIGDLVGTLDTEKGQQTVEAYFPPNMRFLIIDNLSAWTSGGGEDLHGWQAVKSWLIQLRLRGIAVLLIHHAGKGGGQRGTSAHEDLVDYSIEVSPVFLEDEPEATAFRVEHKKLRDQLPHLKSPYSFRIRTVDGAMRFSAEAVVLDSQKQLDLVVSLHQQGLKGKDIAKESGLSEATVSRRLKEHRESRPKAVN